MSKKLIKEVKGCFLDKFKVQPLIVFSPGRINLIGEHTDYNDGFAFPAAINKGIALAISKSNSNTSNAYALNKEELYEFKIENLKPLEGGGWRNYVLGVVAELQKIGKQIGDFNSLFAGNIPSGAGMSSSAALENSFVFGLNELFDLGLTKNEMILVSQKAEHNFAGVKCGIMDQYASMFGVKKSALLLDCRTVESRAYKINFKDYKLMLDTYGDDIGALVAPELQHLSSENKHRIELVLRNSPPGGHSLLPFVMEQLLLRAGTAKNLKRIKDA